MSSLNVTVASAMCLALALGGCEKSSKAAPKPAPSATATATTRAPVASSAAPAVQQQPSAARPKHLDTKLTEARRSKIDKAYPEAKGFLDSNKVEARLMKEKLGSKSAAMHAFDRVAKGKWVLFTGPLDNASAQGFRLGVKYTPRLKGDRLGLSQQFFMVQLSGIKGYDSATMKNGTEAVVLAKYQGKGKAGPGYELVAQHNW